MNRYYQSIGVESQALQRKFTFPSVLVLIGFCVLYLLKWLPPLPLHLAHIGIYHRVQKSTGQFLVFEQRPWWKFWHRGDQEFLARPGDSVFSAVSIFAPKGFSDTVYARFELEFPKKGWVTSDRIPLSISGGRDRGFRGFVEKKNYEPGSWRIKIETSEGREIGRLYFEIVTDLSTEFREFNLKNLD